MKALMKHIKESEADFDKIYYESDTYLLGKKFVEEGLKKVFFIKKKMEVFGSILLPMDLMKKLYEERWHFSLYNTGYRTC